MKKLSISAAWLYLAVAFANTKWHETWGMWGTSSIYGSDGPPSFGLCSALEDMYFSGRITSDQNTSMRDNLRELFGTDNQGKERLGYWWRPTRIGCQERVLACGLLAAMTARGRQ